jgi:hypothetical protein
MPLDLTPFPQIPPARTALTSAEVARYITGPAASNLALIETLVEALETAINALPVTVRSSSMPSSADLLDRWVDTSSNNQEKLCVVAYTAGNGTSSNWESLRDNTATTLAGIIANSNSPDSGHLSTLKAQITAIASDSSLTTEERAILQTLQAEITTRNTEIIASAVSYGLSSTGTYTNYTAAYATWLAMPPLPANPLPVNFATLWNDLLDKEALILASIRSAGTTLLSTLNGDVTAVQNTVDDMAADNKITPQEKIPLRVEYNRIKGEYSKLVALATSLGHTGASQYTTYVASYNAWLTLIGDTLGDVSWNQGTTDTITDVNAWNLAWDNYYLDARALDSYVDTQFKADLNTFNSTLNGISSSVSNLAADGVISGGSEKRLLRQHWQEIQTNDGIIRSQASTFTVSLPSGYTSAYTALDTYLNTTLNVFGNMETNTTVDRAQMETFFTGFRTQYGLLATAVASAQASAITTSTPAGYAEFTATVESIASDGIISAGAEKQRMNALWADIQATHASFVAQATEAGVSTADLQAKYAAIETYLDTIQAPAGGAPNFTITTQDSAIGSAAFYQVFRNYEASKAAMSNSIVASMLATVRESIQSVADMNNDGVITAIEKTTLKRIWDKYGVERDNAVTQANSLSITTERDAMTTAYTALESYLDSLDSGAGIFDNMAANTTLTTGQNNDWDVKWFDFETKIQALLTAIQSKQITNNLNISTAAFLKDGSVTATGAFNLGAFKITNLADGTIEASGKNAVNGGQLYTEQQARTTAISSAQGTLQDAIDQEVIDRGLAVAAEATARDIAIGVHSDLTSGVHGLGAGVVVVGETSTQTLTNKTISSANNTITIDGDNTTISNLETADFKTGVIVTTVGATGSDTAIPSEQAVREAIAAIPAPSINFALAKDCETTNTGTDVVVAEGTLVLPAGKTWKWVQIYISIDLNENESIGIMDKIEVDSNNDTTNFAIMSASTSNYASQDTKTTFHSAEGAPSVTNQDITVKAYFSSAGDILNNTSRSAYFVGIAT